MSSSSQNSSHIDELESPTLDDPSNDEYDEFADKSATLKAGQQLDSITVNTNNINNQMQKINRFNSDKSIYYSSEVIAETAAAGANTNGNNLSLNVNENDTSNSNNSSSNPLSNVSITFSPSGSTSLPPVLPPLPPTSVPYSAVSLTSKISPPSQCPPPLPPLPPALASKYALKTGLYLETIEPLNGTNNNNNSPGSKYGV